MRQVFEFKYFDVILSYLICFFYHFVYAISEVTNCRRCFECTHKNTSNNEICRLSWLWIYSLQKNRLLVFFVRSQFLFALRLTAHWSVCILICTPTGYRSAGICVNIILNNNIFVGKRNEKKKKRQGNWTKPFKISNYRCYSLAQSKWDVENEIFFNESLTTNNETTVNSQFTMRNLIVN